jgi:hypothetical protein
MLLTSCVSYKENYKNGAKLLNNGEMAKSVKQKEEKQHFRQQKRLYLDYVSKKNTNFAYVKTMKYEKTIKTDTFCIAHLALAFCLGKRGDNRYGRTRMGECV